MFENAKIADKVWSIEFGWGKIINIIKNSTYPLIVKFNKNSSIITFDLDGKYTKIAINPTLFWDEIKFEIPEKPKSKFLELEDGEEAYYITIDGLIISSKSWCAKPLDKNMIEQGNVFKAKNEAEKEAELRAVKYRVKKRIWELNGGEFIAFRFGECNWTFALGVEYIIPDNWYNKKTYPNWQYLKSSELVKQLIDEMYDDLMLIRSE